MSITRREALGLSVATGLLAPAGLKAWVAPGGKREIAKLGVCGVRNPLALGSRAPAFSWLLEDETAGARQKAYRITVARSESDLDLGRDLLWDSGRVASARNLGIAYGGPSLPPRARAYWRVELWSGEAPAIRSAASVWETGLGDNPDWNARWIAGETEAAKLDREAGLTWITSKPTPKFGATRLFRKTIESAEDAQAELLLSAHELQGIWLNGQPLVAEQPWPASWTAMACYPVALRKGSNVLALEVKRIFGFGQPLPMVAAILRHGKALRHRTALVEGWKASVVPSQGWTEPDFDAGAWPDAFKATGMLPVGEPWPNYSANYLRHTFRAERKVRAARLYATALGFYEAEINGRPVDTRKLAPEFSDPSNHLRYQAYDVTHLLKKGENRIGLHLGNGWYGGKVSISGRFSFGPAPCRIIAQLEVEYEDGAREIIGTGPEWETAESPVRADSVYDGEVYDARLERPGWSRPGGTSDGWRPATSVEPPAAPLTPQLSPPIRGQQVLPPLSSRRLENGDRIFDFGQNFAGWPRLALRARAGTRVDLRFAEVLGSDGRIDQSNLRTARQHDIYFASGRGRESWEPRFTYHGFRYVQASGLPERDSDWSLEAVVGHQDLETTGSFRVGDPLIEKFWRNSVWSQKSNFWGLPTDCPQRDERLGWIGDAEVFWPAAAFNMDCAAFTVQVMDQMRASQRADGAFPDCIPPYVPGSDTASPGWADGGIILPYVAWQQYGDSGIIGENWQAMERYLAWIEANNPDHRWTKSRGADYGDWLAVDSDPLNPAKATTPKDLIGTAFWAENARMMAEMAAALGNQEAAKRYRALFGAIRKAFNDSFVNADGTVGNGSQTSYILPIRFGLLEPGAEREAGRRLAADIAKRSGHLSTGFLGTPHILDALAKTGHEEVAVSLLLQRSYPSWGYMAEKGATSMWERWNSDAADDGMNSFNHYAFGAIGSFLFRRIAGIAPAAPGFSRIEIAPIIDPRLGNAGATYRSAAGTIRTDWTARDGRYKLDVELPASVDALVSLPGGRKTEAGPGLHRFSGRLA